MKLFYLYRFELNYAEYKRSIFLFDDTTLILGVRLMMAVDVPGLTFLFYSLCKLFLAYQVNNLLIFLFLVFYPDFPV